MMPVFPLLKAVLEVTWEKVVIEMFPFVLVSSMFPALPVELHKWLFE